QEFSRGSHAVLAGFDQYALGRPKISQVEIRFIRDTSTMAANLLAGAVEATMGRGLSIDQAVQIRDQWKEGRIADLKLTSWARIHPQFLNPTPQLVGELAFRQALIYAIDRQQIADTIQHGLVPVADMLPSPNAPDYPALQSSFVRYGYDARKSA